MAENNIKCKGPKLHKGQQRIVNSIINTPSKYNIVNASRQSGKSFLLKQLVLYYALNNSKYDILIVSPLISQNLKIYDEIVNAIINSGVIKRNNRSEKQIELINGSKLSFKSAENYDGIRGGSHDVVFCDEFAYFKPDAWTLAIRPTMAAKKHSRAFLFSTPRGKNEFYDMSMRGQSDEETNKAYKYFYMSYKENPLYDLDFVNDCKLHYPSAKFQQEFEGLFIDSASVFEYNDCAIVDKYKEPEEGVVYYAGLDLARKKDKTVLTIMNDRGDVVMMHSIGGISWTKIVEGVVAILKKYNAHCIVEVNSIGDVVYEMIEKVYQNISPIFTSNSSKQEYIESLIYSFNAVEISIPTKGLNDNLHLELDVFEMTYSPKTRKVVYAARPGFHDDEIISLVLANKARKDRKSSGEYLIYVGGEAI